jgi:hypothetical protein
MRTWCVVASAVLLAALSACSVAGSSGNATPKSLAERIGCGSSYLADTPDDVGVELVGNCTLRGEEVRLLTFGDNKARDKFVKGPKAFGSRYVTGPGFVVEVKSAGTEAAVKAKL